MGEKHPDRTDRWDKERQALKKMITGSIPPNKTEDDKKHHQ